MTTLEFFGHELDHYEALRRSGVITREEELDFTRELRLQLQELAGWELEVVS